MRLKNMIKGDISFQVKYGFYFVYGILTLLYILVIYAIPVSGREKAASLLIYTDPAAMGLFFMGAIVLLEKSQRVINSIAVSPVRVSEYILSKTVSLSMIATFVSIIISAFSGCKSIFQLIIGTLLGSFLFTLLGLMVAAKVNTLNQFMIATVPFEIIGFVPPMFYLFGYKNPLMLLHPGCVIIRLLQGENGFDILPVLLLLCWLALLYFMAVRIIKHMFRSVGGVKL